MRVERAAASPLSATCAVQRFMQHENGAVCTCEGQPGVRPSVRRVRADWRGVGISLIVGLILAGCMEEDRPFGLVPELEPEATPQAAFICTASVQGGSLSCAPPQPSPSAGISAVIVGGQGTYVLLESSNVAYGSGIFSVDVTVRNLLTQALGTADGVNLDDDGVRVFIRKAPAVRVGSGTVTVANADGTSLISNSEQSYFEYSQVLTPGKRSLPRTWRWNVPETVEEFTFEVYVSAAAVDQDNVIPGLRIEASTISAGDRHACGLTVSGAAYCWGANNARQLGSGSVAESMNTPDSVQTAVRFVSISAGGDHTCGLTSAGAAYCWGSGSNGKLGDNTEAPKMTPVAVHQMGRQFVAISAGYEHTCALTTAGAAYCWGKGESGRLGNGLGNNRLSPVQVSGLDGKVLVSISAGYAHTCAVASDGEAFCWGAGGWGQLGNNDDLDAFGPVAVQPDVALEFAAISAGMDHTCAITTAGEPYCWGDNSDGQLGAGAVGGSLKKPRQVRPHTLRLVAISAGSYHNCGITASGDTHCWGDGSAGQLGNGSTTRAAQAVPVTSVGQEVTAISAGGHFACGATSGGSAYCWGANEVGQLGNGSNSATNAPANVSSITNFALLEPLPLEPGTANFRPSWTTFEAYAYAVRLAASRTPARAGIALVRSATRHG